MAATPETILYHSFTNIFYKVRPKSWLPSRYIEYRIFDISYFVNVIRVFFIEHLIPRAEITSACRQILCNLKGFCQYFDKEDLHENLVIYFLFKGGKPCSAQSLLAHS